MRGTGTTRRANVLEIEDVCELVCEKKKEFGVAVLELFIVLNSAIGLRLSQPAHRPSVPLAGNPVKAMFVPESADYLRGYLVKKIMYTNITPLHLARIPELLTNAVSELRSALIRFGFYSAKF